MDWLQTIGIRNAAIIYGIILVLLLIGMLLAEPVDKPKKSSPVFLIIFIIVSMVFVAFALLNLLNIRF